MKPQDATKDAKRGGSFKTISILDIPDFDPNFQNRANYPVYISHLRLFMVKPGIGKTSDGDMVGDAAASWEISPDKTRLTVKLRTELGTPQKAPLNGRTLDSSDVLYSWQRFSQQGVNRSSLLNSLNPNAPITSVTAPDARTVVIQMKEPRASILAQLGNRATGWFFVVPKEAALTSAELVWAPAPTTYRTTCPQPESPSPRIRTGGTSL
jgi:peptide/nickel transport system substrate-binding protein